MFLCGYDWSQFCVTRGNAQVHSFNGIFLYLFVSNFMICLCQPFYCKPNCILFWFAKSCWKSIRFSFCRTICWYFFSKHTHTIHRMCAYRFSFAELQWDKGTWINDDFHFKWHRTGFTHWFTHFGPCESQIKETKPFSFIPFFFDGLDSFSFFFLLLPATLSFALGFYMRRFSWMLHNKWVVTV